MPRKSIAAALAACFVRPRPSLSLAFGVASGLLLAAGMAIFAIVPALYTQWDWTQRYLSEYAVTPYGWAILDAYVLVGFGVLALALSIGFAGEVSSNARVQAGLGVLLACGVSTLGLVVVSANVPHQIVAEIQAITLALGFILLGFGSLFPGARGFTWYTRFLLGVTALGILRVDHFLPDVGVFERIYFLLLFLWLLIVAWRLGVGRALALRSDEPSVARASATKE
jgi:hypothetical protein